MKLAVYVIDDEYFAVDMLTDYIDQTPGIQLLGSSTDPLRALEELRLVSAPDILFLDLEMPRLNGLQLAKLYRGKTKLVFTTSHRNFGPEAYELGAADYLLKPITYERFIACIEKIKDGLLPKPDLGVKERAAYFVKTDTKGKLTRIIAEEIIYVSSDQNYVIIHLAGEQIKAYLTITEILSELPAALFCQTHRSFIVNLNCVKTVEPGRVRLSDKSVIDVGPKFKDAFLNRLNSKLIVTNRQRHS